MTTHGPLDLSHVSLDQKLKDEGTYDKRLKKAQKRLLALQGGIFHEKQRVIVVFEGFDASGKGGCIRRMAETLDPRGFVVHSIGAPTPEDQARHYLFRFWERMPRPGTITVFDRSWYGRVLTERVRELVDEPAWRRAYRQIRDFETLLTEEGIHLIKIFLHVSPDEQKRRFAERLKKPHKRWKLSRDDLIDFKNRRAYEEAAQHMLDETSTAEHPWTVIGANHKWYARVTALEAIAGTLEGSIDTTEPAVEPGVLEEAQTIEELRKVVASLT